MRESPRLRYESVCESVTDISRIPTCGPARCVESTHRRCIPAVAARENCDLRHTASAAGRKQGSIPSPNCAIVPRARLTLAAPIDSLAEAVCRVDTQLLARCRGRLMRSQPRHAASAAQAIMCAARAPKSLGDALPTRLAEARRVGRHG